MLQSYLCRLPTRFLSITLLVLGINHFGAAWNNNYVQTSSHLRKSQPAMSLIPAFPWSHIQPPQAAFRTGHCLGMNGAMSHSWSSVGPGVRSCSAVLPATAGDSEEDPVDVPPTTRKPQWNRIKGYFRNKTDDGLTFKQRLGKMGVAAVLSYGMISNLNYAMSISLAWYFFSVQTQLSPLAPGQWKPFLGVYSGFWVLNNFIRPLRFGASIAVAPSLDKLVLFFQNRLKVSKSLAMAATVLVVNIFGSISVMTGGIALAALFSGVPIFPPKGMA